MKIFPLHIRKELGAAFQKFGGVNGGESAESIEEIRIRTGQPVIFTAAGKEYFFTLQTGYVTDDRKKAYSAAQKDISDMLVFISRYSLFAFEEEVRNGFLTIEGGHRIGLSGQAVLQAGCIQTIRNISSLNIRVCHEKKECGKQLVPYLYRHPQEKNSGIYNTLIISAPGKGKTTLLRDLIRLLSNGTKAHDGLRVSVVDERSEIAGCYRGVPQNDVGMRTDVLDGCPKSSGMMLLIRTMSPQILAVDELGSGEDIAAAAYAVHCGCSILGSVHARDLDEAFQKPDLKNLLEQGYFERFFVIRQEQGKRLYRLYDGRRRLIC